MRLDLSSLAPRLSVNQEFEEMSTPQTLSKRFMIGYYTVILWNNQNAINITSLLEMSACNKIFAVPVAFELLGNGKPTFS